MEQTKFERNLKDQFHLDKKSTLQNLRTLRNLLDVSIREGMIDRDAVLYNQILALIDDAHIVKTEEDLKEAIAQGKTLETEIDTWLSLHGRTTIGLSWP